MVLSDEERRERHRVREKERRKRPEVKAQVRKYQAISEVKAKVQARRKTPHYKAVAKKRRAKPENLAKERAQQVTPESKTKRRKRQQTPKYIVKAKTRRTKPENKASEKKRNTSPKYRARAKKLYSRSVKGTKIIIARGKRECACCGNKNFKWLQIDHIIPQRRISTGGDDNTQLVRQIMKGKRSPSEFQLLCANCNFAKKDLKACPIDHSLD